MPVRRGLIPTFLIKICESLVIRRQQLKMRQMRYLLEQLNLLQQILACLVGNFGFQIKIFFCVMFKPK